MKSNNTINDEKSVHQFTQLHDIIMYSPMFTKNEKLIYYAVKSHLSKGKNELWASKDRLANIVGLSSKTVQKILKKWREAGYLTIIQANRFKPVVYQFNEDMMIADAKKFQDNIGRKSVPTSTDDSVQVGNCDFQVGKTEHEVGKRDLVGRYAVPMNHTNRINHTNKNNHINRINHINTNENNIKEIDNDKDRVNSSPDGEEGAKAPLDDSVTESNNPAFELVDIYEDIMTENQSITVNTINPPNNHPFPEKLVEDITNPELLTTIHHWWDSYAVPAIQMEIWSHDTACLELDKLIDANLQSERKVLKSQITN